MLRSDRTAGPYSFSWLSRRCAICLLLLLLLPLSNLRCVSSLPSDSLWHTRTRRSLIHFGSLPARPYLAIKHVLSLLWMQHNVLCIILSFRGFLSRSSFLFHSSSYCIVLFLFQAFETYFSSVFPSDRLAADRSKIAQHYIFTWSTGRLVVQLV